MSYKKIGNIAGWLVFAIATIVYFFSVERTGSLWDCGEFITGAYKLQVVHPPGAPLFILVGRMFTIVAELLSDNPEHIGFAVNFMSGICTAFAAAFVCWMTFMLGKLTLADRESDLPLEQSLGLAGAGIVAGLTTTFATSIWFSAVEGEVYAMSTFFTALTFWAVVKWYCLPKGQPKADRWLIFAFYVSCISIGVHLLSLLTFPALALFYYFKRYEKHTVPGMAVAAGAGLGIIFFIQKIIITGIPTLWSWYELMMVNGFGLPQHTGLIPLILTIGAIIFYALRFAHQRQSALAQKLTVAVALGIIGFSTIGVVVIRANASPPINMNSPSDAMRLIPYLNREQYGERPLLYGPHFEARPVNTDEKKRYGYVEEAGKYQVVDRKLSYVYKDNEKMFFPRMGDYSQNRDKIYRQEWMGGEQGPPSQADNISFLVRYQLGWMYWRYFMWNFAGRQNGDQGYTPADKKSGHWVSGIPPVDNIRLYDHSKLPESMREHEAWNRYYLLPFIFGLIGLFYHARRRKEDFIAMLTMFLLTGIGIIIYSNQPPHEPRERDYALMGSFFTYGMWMGMAVLALMQMFKKKLRLGGMAAAPLAAALVLTAPVIMGVQNWDDHSRRHHKGARDYALNFLNSVEENAIVFTYGDNDTYPLWYAQEVEEYRRDVRVINLSLIAVDWYIDQMRRKVNESDPIKLTISPESYRGYKRNQVPVIPPQNNEDRRMSLIDALKFIDQDHSARLGGKLESYLPAKRLYIDVDKNKILREGVVGREDSARIVPQVEFNITKKNLYKGDVAVLDILGSNLWERPIYFAVTARQEALLGLRDYTQLEGLALRVIPVKSESSESRTFGMVGNGRVAEDLVYDNVVNKWRWGNFDKMDLFVDRSYGPSVQSMQFVITRTIQKLLNQGDKQRAIDMADEYFQAFPHMNFPYNYNTLSVIRTYIEADVPEKAKPHLRILAQETADQLEFFYSIDPEVLQSSFNSDLVFADRTRQQLLQIVQRLKDKELEDEFKSLFEGIELQPTRN